MEFRVRQKSLFLTPDMMDIWVSSVSSEICEIHISDLNNNVTYNVAEFNGCEYKITHMQHFNETFVNVAKKRPQLLRDLNSFFMQQYTDPDGYKDLKMQFKCFKRRFNIFVNKTPIAKKITYGTF